MKIKRFFECCIDNTICNLKCPYCYVRNSPHLIESQCGINLDVVNKMLIEDIGPSFFSICSRGETTKVGRIIDTINFLVNQGHIVNITTNGTFDEDFLLKLDKIQNIHFSFSLHYKELLKNNLLNRFSSNIKKIHNLNSSYTISLVLNPEYYDIINDIKKFTIDNFNCVPKLYIGRDIYYNILYGNNKEKFLEILEDFNDYFSNYIYNHYICQKLNSYVNCGQNTFVLDLYNGFYRPCYHYPNMKRHVNDIKRYGVELIKDKIYCDETCFNCSFFHFCGSIENKLNFFSIRDHGNNNINPKLLNLEFSSD